MDSFLLVLDSVVEGWQDMRDILSSWFSFQWLVIRPEWFQWRSHYLPILMVIITFWPIVLTLILALTAASTWLFWLLTSVLFGILQLNYVTYQFIMISVDIMGLSTLKTYSMLRSQLLYYLGKSGLQERKSRRRVWRQKLDNAGTYEQFQKIIIEPKHTTETKRNRQQQSSSSLSLPSPTKSPCSDHDTTYTTTNTTNSTYHSSPKRGIARSSSFGDPQMHTLPESIKLPRNKSFGGRDFEEWDLGTDSTLNSLDPAVTEELGRTAEMLVTTTARLREVRQQATMERTEDAASSLKYLLSGVVKRNHLTVDDILIENGRSVAELGQFGLSQESRNLIRGYLEEVQTCLEWISDSSSDLVHESLTKMDLNSDITYHRHSELSDRITLVRKMKQNMGRTALMLSGGGAQAMYHLGTIRALIESKLYDNITVISGTSGGSITAAMCAVKTSDELFRDVCISTVSTDFMLDGTMQKDNIRWFPAVTEMGAYWLKHKLLVDSADFKRCCDYYFGDMTFEEAFVRTGKHVCITVSASRATGGTAQRLLLNHISTPHVTVSSAVAASCALPGVMAPAKLFTKDNFGNKEPFEVDGVEWIDGSVQADLPFERISTLFNVSNYVVCQTNFHVLPFLNKEHHPNQRSAYWRIFQTLEWDMRNRALNLSRLGLFPRIFGQDISKVFKQKYHGNLTLVPRFTAMQTFGLKALANPTVKDMEGYLKYGQIAAWPYLNVIQDMMRLERSLDDCIARLEERYRQMNPDQSDWSFNGDDVESIASSSLPASSVARGVRFVGRSDREAERLKHKVMSLERENDKLKQQLEIMERKLHGDEDTDSKENISPINEREVWSHLRRQRR